MTSRSKLIAGTLSSSSEIRRLCLHLLLYDVFTRYTFKLHENPEFGWSPSFNSKTFIGLLSNITAIKIRGNYIPNGQGFLDEVQLETATMEGAGAPANWVEQCECPAGFEGQFCERCIIGYYHEDNGGPFARCVI